MKYIIGNWKANLNIREVDHYCQVWQEKEVNKPLNKKEKKVIVAVPSIFYAYLQTKKVAFSTALQDISLFPSAGAHTGEITIDNLTHLLPEFVLVGHSERRSQFGETNEVVAMKAKNLLKVGITPIICVDLDQIGELAQLLKDVPGKYLLAYEPISAIGSGNNLSGQLLKESFALLRQVFGQQTSLLYGGSVKLENLKEYQNVCDGVLVGGASLKADEFWQLAQEF